MGWLRDVSWAGEPDAADVARALAPDGVVPRVSSGARAFRPASPIRVQHGLGAAGQSVGAGAAAREGVQDCETHELLGVPPMRLEQGGPGQLDLAAIRERLAGARGKLYWRSLEELAESEAFQEFLHREFPRHASEWVDPVTRREFLRVMGASLALAGLGACTRQPDEKIVPYVRAPEEIVPGRPLFFATAMPLRGFANGVLVESHMGRPTKVEGNPEHPASLGATDAFAQAAVLGLYDPDRSQVIRNIGEIRPWKAFVDAIGVALDGQRERQGAGLRFLTETITSPTLAQQLSSLVQQLPRARWHQYEPVSRDNARAGALLAFGEAVEAQYRFENAEVIVSLDADFLACGPGSVRYTRDFTRRRAQRTMNRLYVVETMPSVTGAKADHRLALRAGDIEALTRRLAAAVSVR